jgi:uncharacterized protein YutE (UPF0331/DUF86 family)
MGMVLNRHETIGIWEGLDLNFMWAASSYALDDDEVFDILTEIASVCNLSTYEEFWRDLMNVNVSRNMLVHLYDLIGRKPEKLMESLSDLYDLYVTFYIF